MELRTPDYCEKPKEGSKINNLDKINNLKKINKIK